MRMYDTLISGVYILGNSDLEADLSWTWAQNVRVPKKTVTIFYLKGGDYWAEDTVVPYGLLVKVCIQLICLHISNNAKIIGKVQKRMMKSIGTWKILILRVRKFNLFKLWQHKYFAMQ